MLTRERQVALWEKGGEDVGLEADPEGFGQVGPRRKGKKKVPVRNNQPVWGVVGIAEESC